MKKAACLTGKQPSFGIAKKPAAQNTVSGFRVLQKYKNFLDFMGDFSSRLLEKCDSLLYSICNCTVSYSVSGFIYTTEGVFLGVVLL